jgi:hypothetical protein
LFQPTSVVMIASRGNCARTSARMRSGIIGKASDVAIALLAAGKLAAARAICSTIGPGLRTGGIQLAGHLQQHAERFFRSATAPISVGKLRPISLGSMSM